MAEALGKAKAILLRNHGSVVVSEEGPEDTVLNLINLEVQAKLNFYAFSAVGKDYVKLRVPEDQRIAYLTRLRKVLKDRSLIEIQCEYNARMAKF
jgi:ribulose-5-phosphate 4-epimerase/fuculose-1-phosphate aldolase